MGVPKVYRQSREPINVNYDWNDLASGQGYVTFYCSKATASYVSMTEAILSSTIDEKSATRAWNSPSSGWVTRIEHDFDTSEFNLQRVIQGTAFWTGTWFATRVSGSGLWQCRVVVNVYHYDGSTETLIGTGTTDSAAGYSGVNDRTGNLPIELTETILAAGDTLRINVQVQDSGGNPDTGYCGVAYDPLNRDGSYLTEANSDTRQMIIRIPFKIET